VAVDTDRYPRLSGYVDPGTGQVNPLEWDSFQAIAQDEGAPMLVSSNGLGNFYQQPRDNIRLLAEGKGVVAVNVYNATIDGEFGRDTFAEALLANLVRQQQTVQVAIQEQMREAITYNGQLDELALRPAGATLTDYVGHSQGTINGNLAVDAMSAKEKSNIRVYSVGTASWHLPKDVAAFVNIFDKKDPVTRWTLGRSISYSLYALTHDNYTTVETDIDAHSGLKDTGNHHSFYLYAKTQEFRDALKFISTPAIISKPFAEPVKP
jgi:hypothetical protein